MVHQAPQTARVSERWAHRRDAIIRIATYLFVTLASTVATYLGVCFVSLFAYSFTFPPITGVQLQRAAGGLFRPESVERRYDPVPLTAIDVQLARAVVSGEDSRFFMHWGIDWSAIEDAIEEYQSGEDLRGGSSITQQLVKNLFMTTHRSYIRKALEVPLTYGAEALLSKRRILELYLNVIEWGPGVYGAEAASMHYYGTSAQSLSRYQAAALAACIPNPQARRPETVGWYRDIILGRMDVLGPLPIDAAGARARRTRPPTPTSSEDERRPLRATEDASDRTASLDSARVNSADSTTPGSPPLPDTAAVAPALPETLATDSIEVP